MEETEKQLNRKGNIAIINGKLGHKEQMRLTEESKPIIARYPNMKVIVQGSAKLEPA